MAEKEMVILSKLEYLKEVKYRMDELEKMRSKLNEEVDLINYEERCLHEYQREMDSLIQEKMTHVEELRQIHSDINMLENVFKQSKDDRDRHENNIKLIHHQIQPLKDLVDKMRSEIGLSRLNDKDDETIDKLDIGSTEKRPFFNVKPTNNEIDLVDQSNNRPVPEQNPLPTVNKPSSANKPFSDNTNTNAPATNTTNSPFSSSLASLMSGFQDKHQQATTYSRMLMSGTGQSVPSFHHDTSSSVAASAAFRQQPPPMKSCLSCHQQIHRNAPICPLCKAKSRSRHPKRRNNPK